MKKKTDTNKLPSAFKAMADSTRLKILLMLENKPRTVGEIVDFFNLSQPTITRHLQALASAGLVKRTRDGQHVRYELNAEHLGSVCMDLIACFPCCSISVKPSSCSVQVNVLEYTKVAKRDKNVKAAKKLKGGQS
jgi:DNA-binding transcriptional ArsR family regulator